jgi:GTP-binding protein EngB required for normal cell division
MFEIMERASEERRSGAVSEFEYAVVLTKADKVSAKQLAQSAATVHDTLRGTDLVKVLTSSSLDKDGADGLWKLIHSIVTK